MGNAGSTITGTLILGALVLKASDFVKYFLALFKEEQKTKEDGRNGLLSLIITSVLGVAIVLGVAETQWADEIPIGAETLSSLSFASLVVFGLVVSSFGSTLYDLKKAIDNTESSSTPRVTGLAEKERTASLERQFGQFEG